MGVCGSEHGPESRDRRAARGVGGRPLWNQAAVDYVRAWGATVEKCSVLANFSPQTFFTTDRLTTAKDRIDRAFFGQLQVPVSRDKLDLTLGFRFTGDEGAFCRIPTRGCLPPGDRRGVQSLLATHMRLAR